MDELEKIAAAVERIAAAGKRGLLVTVAGTRGSTYRRTGARCVIAEDGQVTGAISGGCVERDLALRSKENFRDFSAHVVTYDSSSADDIVFGLGLGCRGRIEMLVQPFDAAHMPVVPRAGVHGTVIVGDKRHRVGQPFRVSGTHERTHRQTIAGCDVLVEVIRPPRAVVIFASGPDGEPVAALARSLGWRADLVPSRDVPDLAPYDAAVVMTHNFLRDVALLEVLLPSPMRYIGVLGPKSRGEELLTQLGNVPPEARERLHSPIGLDLGAETPEEIALSIVAELQAFFAGTSAEPLRDKEGAIHEPVTVPAAKVRR